MYKYMGLIFTSQLSWTHAKEKMASQVKKAILSLKYYQKPFGHFPSNELFKIFDLMIKPILCYGVLNIAKLLNMCITTFVKNIYPLK
jgi:hypothetical protein